jgi:hypothetical protein
MPCPKHPNRALKEWAHGTQLKCTAKVGDVDGKPQFCDYVENVTVQSAGLTPAPNTSAASYLSEQPRATNALVSLASLPQWLAEPLAQYANNPAFELLLPSIPVNAQLGYGCRVAVSIVQLSADPNEREVFQVGSREGQTVFAYAKPALEKLAEAAGINIKTARMDNRQNRDYCEFQALGAMKGSGGQEIVRTATKAFDMQDVADEAFRNRMKLRNEDEATARKNVQAEMMAFKKHIVRRTETGAMLAVMRSLMAIKSGLTAAQVNRPKVLARVEFNPDPQGDPVVQRFLLEKGYAATTALFGPTAPTVGADVRDVTEDEPEDEGFEQEPLQLGNAPVEDVNNEPDWISRFVEMRAQIGISSDEANALAREHGGDFKAMCKALSERGAR